MRSIHRKTFAALSATLAGLLVAEAFLTSFGLLFLLQHLATKSGALPESSSRVDQIKITSKWAFGLTGAAFFYGMAWFVFGKLIADN